jgi:hypothetical protein
MSETVFTKVDYDLGSLVKFIGLAEIGLPDIQRPFVWKNAKVAISAGCRAFGWQPEVGLRSSSGRK